MNGVKLTFEEKALKTVVSQALAKKTGARGLRAIIENLLLEIMFEVPDNVNATEVIIDKDVVEGKKPPIIISEENAA